MKVVPCINVPFDLVPVSLGRKGAEAMAPSDICALCVSALLVLLVVAVIGVDDVTEFANFALHVFGLDLGVVERRVLVLFMEARFLELVPQARDKAAAALGTRHCNGLSCWSGSGCHGRRLGEEW